MGPLDATILQICRRARAEGRERLTEPEGLAVAARLGFGTPRCRVVADADGVDDLDLDAFSGDRVVVKVVSARLTHKSDLGGVEVVERTRRAVAAAVARMDDRLGDRLDRRPPDGFSVNEWVDHDPTLGGELLVGVRWSEAFGPVTVLGPGGLDTERLAAGGFPPLLLSPLFASTEHLDRLLGENAFARLLVEPGRGREARLPRKRLARLLQRLLDLARTALPEPLAEIELNPVALTPGGPVALDAVARLGTDTHPGAPRPLDKIGRLLHPASVAVVGVSRRLNPGRRILRNLLAAGFAPQRLWVVKEGCDELDGCPCVDRLQDLPAPVDLLVVAVAAEAVPELVEEVVEGRWAESLVLIPGGLGETEASRGRAERMERRLRESRESDWGGPVINGGNCLGVRSVPGRVDTLFVPREKLRFPEGEPAPVALLSQSGAFAIARASQLARLNPRYLVTTGNQLDLSVADYLTHLAHRDGVRVFACYVEGFRAGDGARFLQAAEAIRASGRAVVLYHAGRTAAGAVASASHTASVAGDYTVARELARQAGVLVAESLQDFHDLVSLAWRLGDRRPTGRRLGAVSNAGFECVAMADNLGPLELADLTAGTRERLAELLTGNRVEGIVEVHNPLDLTPILGDAAFADAAAAVLADGGVDLGVVACVPLTAALATLPADPGGDADAGEAPDLVDATAVGPRLVRLWRETTRPWVAVVDSGPLYDPLAALLEEGGVPVFRTADRAVRLLGRWAAWRLRGI